MYKSILFMLLSYLYTDNNKLIGGNTKKPDADAAADADADEADALDDKKKITSVSVTPKSKAAPAPGEINTVQNGGFVYRVSSKSPKLKLSKSPKLRKSRSLKNIKKKITSIKVDIE